MCMVDQERAMLYDRLSSSSGVILDKDEGDNGYRNDAG